MKAWKLTISIFAVLLYGCVGDRALFDTNPQYLEPVSPIFMLQANSSINNEESVLTYYDEGRADFKKHGIITILNEEHRDQGSFELYYDKFRELDYVKIQVRNNQGVIVGKYTLKDAGDYSASGSNFFSDVRVKVIDAYYYSYPYTVEYEYKYEYSGSLNLPSWYPKSYSQSVQQASFEIIDYSKGNIRYHSRNIEDDPEVTEYPEYTKTKWTLSNELAEKREAYSPPYSEIFPNVLTSASNFEVGGSSGNASSWALFGKWYYELSEGKRELPEAAKLEIDQILQGVQSDKDKVKKLYKYMQSQMRYVSIQLGLGGWEPYPAEFVYQNKYGDCKALVNFMHAILEYAGVEAEPALIRNGLSAPAVVSDFPSNQFNHVVLRVTLASGEVMWLECTSKYIKPGRIGAGNEGKNALLVNDSGGEIIKTYLSDAQDNMAQRVQVISLQEDGTAIINSSLTNKGAMDDNFLHQLKPLSEKKREEWLVESISLNDFNVQSFEFSGLEGNDLETGYEIKLLAKDFSSTTAQRLFVQVNPLNQWNIYIPDEELRSTSLQLPYKFSEMDSTTFELPSGYIVETMPENEQVDNNFGSFELSLSEDNGRIIMKRTLVIQKQDIPKEEYKSFKEFFTTVNKADQSQFVIVKE